MHVYLVGRIGYPSEYQFNLESLRSSQALSELSRLAFDNSVVSSNVVSKDISFMGIGCVRLSWRTAFLIAHSAYPALYAVDLLKRIDAGEPLITVLHLAASPSVIDCREESAECIELLQMNLEKAIKRQNGISHILRQSEKLSRQKVRFKRHNLARAKVCCGCVCM